MIGFEALCGLDPKRRDRGKHGARNRFVDFYWRLPRVTRFRLFMIPLDRRPVS
jgi:hypothetical protein